VVTVWAGIVSVFSFGPCYPDNSARRFTLCFWRKGTENAGRNSLISQEKHWFQHGDAAAYFAHQVREHLTATYNSHWIGQGRSMAWPPRSPDLTPMDFFLWGHIKALFYMLPVDFEEDLSAHIIEAAGTIRQQPGIFECTRQSLLCHRLILRLVAIHLNICPKLVQNTTFFQNTSVVLLEFQL